MRTAFRVAAGTGILGLVVCMGAGHATGTRITIAGGGATETQFQGGQCTVQTGRLTFH